MRAHAYVYSVSQSLTTKLCQCILWIQSSRKCYTKLSYEALRYPIYLDLSVRIIIHRVSRLKQVT